MRRALLPIASVIGLAVAAGPAAAAQPSAITASAPKTAVIGQAFAVDLQLSGDADVAALEAVVSANAAGADVAAVVPAAGGAKTLDAARTGGAARVGYYGASGKVARGGTIAQVLVTPKRPGVLKVRLGGVTLVDASGKVIPSSLRTRTLSVRVGASKATLAAPALKAMAARAAHATRLDVDGNGVVAQSDLYEAIYAWSVGRGDGPAAKGGGDANGDGYTTVADIQLLSASIAPQKAAVRSAKDFVPTRTWVVNTTDDLPDATPGNRICATSAGTCSLRAAIDEANRWKGDDGITFAIAGTGPKTIQLTSRLTQINPPVAAGRLKIDGYTQPGSQVNTDPMLSNAIPGITLRGWSTGQKDTALMITSAGNVIRGLAFHNIGRGILLIGANASANEIVGNFFGMDSFGTRSSFTGYAGINLDAAPNNIIGKPNAADRNVIAGFFYGMDHVNPGTDHNVTQNNLIGLSPSGASWGGGCDGVDHNVGPKFNQLGGLGPMERNVIVGYGCDGVEYSHGWNQAMAPRADRSLQFQVNGNKAQGNYIGLKPDGTYAYEYLNARGNEYEGDASAVNIIDVANDNVVEGNYLAAYLNAVQIFAVDTNRNIVKNNIIGIDTAGNPSYVGNSGVHIRWNTNSNQVIGNTIANTGLGGVRIDDSNNDNNLISQNTFSNVGRRVGGMAIDLAPLGVVNANDVNDIDNGANSQLNFPVITSATTTGVSGTAPRNSKIEVYKTFTDPGLYGPGEVYLGTATSSTLGAWSLAVALQPGDIVTTTTTDAINNTSEFGANVAVPGAPPNVRGVTFDSFNGFGGVSLTDIAAGTAPTSSSRVGSFAAPANRGENHGTRLRALLRAPQTGEYTFWVASDDQGRVFLSTDASPANRRVIAEVQGWVPEGAYDQTAAQRSLPITLQAGQAYYLEAYMKEGGGGDHLSVAWQGPGIATRAVIAGQYLTPTVLGASGWNAVG